MYKELFGVFGDRDDFRRFRTGDEYDAVVAGDRLTVGLRDPALGVPGRSDVYEGERGRCVVWGEAFWPAGGESVAARLFDAYAERGTDAFADLNGSYIVALERDGEALVATDPIRSWECFYTDDPGVRVFGSDAASVGRTVDAPRVSRRALREFLHLSVVFGQRTLLRSVDRVPFDAVLGPDSVASLDRFVYEPESFDHAAELARLLRKAIDRRSGYPGDTGLLLSAGYDSRALLAELPDVDQCYTVGEPDGEEVDRAAAVAAQYGADHSALRPTEEYLAVDAGKSRYGQGIKESLHVHHADQTDAIRTESVYHGLLWDTLFRGHFLEPSTLGVGGLDVPLGGLDSDPDPVDALLDRIGYSERGSRRLTRYTSVGPSDPAAFARRAVSEAVADVEDRADDVQNVIDACGITNQPTVPFRTHLADNFLESFVAVDRDLLAWHLRTPPEHRSNATFLSALRRLDDDILRHRPPNRPFDSTLLNGAIDRCRRTLPFVEHDSASWPSRAASFERHRLDERLFPERSFLHELPSRHKLRVADVERWVGECLDADGERGPLDGVDACLRSR